MSKNTRRERQRIDLLLVEKGLAANREKAAAMLMAGEVTVSGAVVTKSGTLVDRESVIELAERPEFVSRGGIKLAHALEQFGLDVSGEIAADIGASTGGFTDCLLKHGAAHVFAIDVGKGQLDLHLRNDARVTVLDNTNARYPFNIPEQLDLATIDVSFISATKVIPPVIDVLKNNGLIIVLVKPQFEARREEVGRGGVVRDADTHARVLGRFLFWANSRGLRLRGLVASPIAGAAGNREFFILFEKSLAKSINLT